MFSSIMEIELPIIVWLLIFIIISILVVLGGFILITLIVACIKALIKQIKQMGKWGVDSEILCDYNTKK